MFKPYYLIIAFSFFFMSLKAQWNWINPKPESYHANKIIFTSDSVGFIFNEGGSLIKTTDQGNSWRVVDRFNAMLYLDILDSTAVVAGNSGAVYLSHDNASNWQKVTVEPNGPIIAIDIVSRDTIFLASHYKLFSSFNRGLTWNTVALPPQTGIQSFDFVDSKLGFVGKTQKSMLKTVDGGQTWVEVAAVNYSPSEFLCIKFFNKNVGYAFRGHGDLLKTTNGGQTWTESQIVDRIFAMSLPSASIGYMAGDHGAMYRTSNAGTSWEWISSLNGRLDVHDIRSMYFIDNNIGFATGEMGRIIKTVDGGENWVDYSPIHGVSDFSFPDMATGYITSGKSVYKSIDSGRTWNALPLTYSNENNRVFQKVHFFSPDTGFVTSSEFLLVHRTNDGGQTWTSVQPTDYNTFKNTSSVSICDDTTAIITITYDGSYLITKSHDRGKTWIGIDSNSSSGLSFKKIHFLDEKNGFAYGYRGLYKTNDSAKTWTLLLNENASSFTSFWFINERIGFISDDNYPGFRHTIDSGKTWIPVPFPYNDRVVNSIHFINDAIGYVICSSGSIYQTADSGANWLLYGKLPYQAHFHEDKIKANKNGIVYFGGLYGTIVSASTRYILSTEWKCIGSFFSYVSDVEGSTYLWEKSTDGGQSFSPLFNDGIHSGVNTKWLSIASVPAEFHNFKYRCLVNEVNYSKEFQVKFLSEWTGAIDFDWNNPGNWSCRRVPDLNTDVLIGKGTVILRSNATVSKLTLLYGASITIDPGYELKILD